MRLALTSLAATLFLLGAFAATAQDDDTLGFWFDTSATVNCVETAPYVTLPMYLILTSPSSGEVYGFEFGYTGSGSYLISGTTFMGYVPIDVGSSDGNHIVGLGQAMPTSDATVLATISVFVMDGNQIRFDLHGADPSSVDDDVPALLYADDEIVPTVLSSPDGFPNARINGKCNPDVDEGSWDEVKSLYQ